MSIIDRELGDQRKPNREQQALAAALVHDVGHGAERGQLRLLHRYMRAVDDPFLWLVGEIVRRVQPRDHWMHRSLPYWYRYATGKRGRPVISLRAAADAPVRRD